MILLEVKRAIQAQGTISLADLARRLNSDPETLRPMVEHWVRRGAVRRLDLGCDACSCAHCGPMTGAEKEILTTARAPSAAAAICGSCRPR